MPSSSRSQAIYSVSSQFAVCQSGDVIEMLQLSRRWEACCKECQTVNYETWDRVYTMALRGGVETDSGWSCCARYSNRDLSLCKRVPGRFLSPKKQKERKKKKRKKRPISVLVWAVSSIRRQARVNVTFLFCMRMLRLSENATGVTSWLRFYFGLFACLGAQDCISDRLPCPAVWRWTRTS